MSRTWPEMFLRQMRVVVAERHTLAGSSVSPAQTSKQNLRIPQNKPAIDRVVTNTIVSTPILAY